MFNNLQMVLNQKGISTKQYAEFLGIGEKNLLNKMNGTSDFTYLEFMRTCNLLLPEYKADYLFTDYSQTNVPNSCQSCTSPCSMPYPDGKAA